MTNAIMPTYARLPVSFTRGQGAWLWDQNNVRYLDALSGIAVCNLGHAHPAIHQAIAEQSRLLLHTSNLYEITLQSELANQLAQLSGMSNAFFCNSGAEANETAIKLARLYGHSQDIAQPTIIVMNNSFHGRTLATLSATGNPKVHEGFTPLVDGFIHVPFNDLSAIEKVIADNPDIVAVMAEPIQGEGGVNIPAPNYLNKLRQLCDQHKLLLILDEIQTGIGRTGRFLAYQHNDILPDICTLAKALGNGVPIGACLATGKAAQLLTAGKHGSTFGGNLLACRAALSVLDVMQKDNLIQAAVTQGNKIVDEISKRLNRHPLVAEIRHQGLMIAIELTQPCPALTQEALDQKVLINITAEKVIRLLPPLIISDEQIILLADTIQVLVENTRPL
ncbi:MAG: aspartate aminotransferase family protein [Methylococcales bacterium]|jgi:acetylornithine aminotransferase|nr:aspartate aminotransferase family protein [Methylococcaceae bacterium]HIL41612.1 aspartate aminotransferase family protein [Methylococcales bacterium]